MSVGRSQLLHGQRHGSAACWDGGFKSHQAHGCLPLVSVVCCQVSVSGWSLVQRSPTEFGVSECNCNASAMRRPWPAKGCFCHGKMYCKLVQESASKHSKLRMSIYVWNPTITTQYYIYWSVYIRNTKTTITEANTHVPIQCSKLLHFRRNHQKSPATVIRHSQVGPMMSHCVTGPVSMDTSRIQFRQKCTVIHSTVWARYCVHHMDHALKQQP
jgi:hypothetical protein